MRVPLATRCVLCSLISVGFVLGLYALTPTYSNYLKSREDVVHIRHRLAAASVLTLIVVLALHHCYEWITTGTVLEQVPFLAAFGFRLDTATRSCKASVVLMSVFYGGPILTKLALWLTCLFYEVHHDGRCEPRKRPLLLFNSFSGLFLASWHEGCSRALFRLLGSPSNVYIPLRSLVFAPISEEIVFRAAIVVILFPDLRELSVWIAPLLFAPAHLHHGIEKYRSGSSATQVFVESSIQLLYTYIFGAIATLLFLRTGNILTPIISHTICNIMQLPDTSFAVPPSSPDSTELSVLYGQRTLLVVLHVIGLVAFSLLAMPLTKALAEESIYAEVF